MQLENSYDSGQENTVEIIQQTLQEEVISLGNIFIQDIQDRIQQHSIPIRFKEVLYRVP